MKIPEITVAKMREIDRLMVKKFGVEVMQMMEIAGANTARTAVEIFNPKNVSILCGKGNNGGDGIAAARHLKNFGINVEIILAENNLRKLPKHQLKSAKNFGIRVKEKIGKPNLIIDCLLGYNAKGAPISRYKKLIKEAQQFPVLSVDIPTGWEAEKNLWHEPAFLNSTVVTIGLPKKGMKKDKKIKELYLMDIGIPKEAYKKVGIKIGDIFKKKSVIKV